MTTELRMLGYSIFLGLAYVFVAAILGSQPARAASSTGIATALR
jgi:hypothetical protein